MRVRNNCAGIDQGLTGRFVRLPRDGPVRTFALAVAATFCSVASSAGTTAVLSTTLVPAVTSASLRTYRVDGKRGPRKLRFAVTKSDEFEGTVCQ